MLALLMVVRFEQIKLTAQEEVALELRASQVGVIEFLGFELFLPCVYVHCIPCLKADI